MSRRSLRPLRRLVLVLGDQLDADAAAFDGFDPAKDALWMAEAAEESTHIPSSQMRTAFFLSAMRHFAAELRARSRPLHYTALDDPANRGSLATDLRAAIDTLRPQDLVITAPGDWRVLRVKEEVGWRLGDYVSPQTDPISLDGDRSWHGSPEPPRWPPGRPAAVLAM